MDYKKRFICEEVESLNKEEKLHILKIIKRGNAQSIMKYPDGSRVILEELPSEKIEEIYLYINNKIN